MSDNWWFRAIAYTAFSAIGGMIGFTMRTIETKQPFKLWRLIVEGFGAAFVGVLVMLLCEAMHLGAQWTGVIVGVCGWLGASTTIRLLEGIVRSRLGAKNAE